MHLATYHWLIEITSGQLLGALVILLVAAGAVRLLTWVHRTQ
jgi:hypothetical protein